MDTVLKSSKPILSLLLAHKTEALLSPVEGTPACRALGDIDEQWPLSTLKERAQFSS